MGEKNCDTCDHSDVCRFKLLIKQILDIAKDCPIEVTVTCKKWITNEHKHSQI